MSFPHSYYSLIRQGCFLIIFMGCALVRADVKMPSVFSDNMVLQRDIYVNVWGWAVPGERVSVYFAGHIVTADTGRDGRWAVKLEPMPMNAKPQELKIVGKNVITFKNVVVGDVWVCSGQSNMEMLVKSCLNAKQEIDSSANPLIRQLKINLTFSLYPKEDASVIPQRWVPATLDNTPYFTAVGYFFAREIVKETGIPIGIINTSWGGTPIDPWIPREGFLKVALFKNIVEQIDSWTPTTESGKRNLLKYIEEMKRWLPVAEVAFKEQKTLPASPVMPGVRNDYLKPTMIFNAMINPITKYGVKGVLWYQGESNGSDALNYMYKMEALIRGWRELWALGDFPFYFVQLANYQISEPNDPGGGDGWAKIREAQLKVLSLVPKTGMAVVIDIGETYGIHPRDKQDVGKRLAAWALANNYNKANVMSGPLYKDFKIEDNKIRISFDHVGGGLVVGEKKFLEPFKETPGVALKSFAIAGQDKKWYWADAVIDGESVLVSSKDVLNPVAVRYAFSLNPPHGVNFYNKESFPASPFRTDSW